jgi:hypothetical protein
LILAFAVGVAEGDFFAGGWSAPDASLLWGEAGELWSGESRLPDFSHAGYRSGEAPIPLVPVDVDVTEYGAVGDGVTDDTDAFLAAIRAVERGAVLVPAGRYRITRPLLIGKSHVVLRGEGRDSTTLFFPLTLHEVLGPGKDGGPTGWSWGGAWIWANPDLERGDSRGPVWARGRKITRVTMPARKGQRWLEVANANRVVPGQWVRIVQRNTDGELALSLHSGHTFDARCIVDRPDFMAVNWLWKVTRIEGDRVYFDRPLRLDVEPTWRAALWRAEPEVREVGIENLTIEFPSRAYPGHHNEPGQNAISLGNTLDSWVRTVAILNADNGIFLWYARYCTVTGLVMAGRGGHYGFNLGGAQDCLVTRFRFENRSVHDTSLSNLANGNVLSWGRGRSINFDHHRGAPYQNLASRIHVGNPRRIWKSSSTPSGHYTAAHETYWNIRPRANVGGLPAWPEMNVIGAVRGRDRTIPRKLGSWIEPVERLRPADLHLAQWARRRGIEPPARRRLPRPLPDEVLARLREAAFSPAAPAASPGGHER